MPKTPRSELTIHERLHEPVDLSLLLPLPSMAIGTSAFRQELDSRTTQVSGREITAAELIKQRAVYAEKAERVAQNLRLLDSAIELLLSGEDIPGS